MPTNDNEVLIKVENVSKKYCRSLKRSLLYGAKDVANSLMPWKSSAQRLEIPELRKNEFWAVKDISFEVRRGECLGLIGHNGAGKSTLLKMLNGLNSPDSGKITMYGRVGALIELSAGFNPVLTGRENIYNQASLLGFSKDEINAKFDDIVEFSELEEFLDMPLQNYSSGMKVKLGFAVSSQLEPDILLIDEVLAVGDVGFRFKCLNKMADLISRCAVIFVSHSMPQVFRICNSLLLLKQGKQLFYDKDVADGVALYFSDFKNTKQLVVGSLEAEITAMEISTAGVSAVTGEMLDLDYGDELNFKVKIKFNEDIASVKVHFLFWNIELLPVMDVLGDDLSGYEIFPGEDAAVEVCARMPHIKLSPGKYTITAVLNSSDTRKIYYRHDSIISINVCAKTMSGSHILETPDWVRENSKVSALGTPRD